MDDDPARSTSVWFFYFVAAALGLSFLVALLVLAWDNVSEREVQKFAYESLSIDDTVRTNARAADDAVENLAALIESVPEISEDQLQDYLDNLLHRYGFAVAVGVYKKQGDGNFVIQSARERDADAGLPEVVTSSAADTLTAGFAAASDARSPIPAGTIERGVAKGRYLLLKSLSSSDPAASETRVVGLLIDPKKMFGDVADRPYMTVRLYSESEGIGGRQLLFERTAAPADDKFAIDTLEESTQVRFERYSMRLLAARQTYWGDLDKGLIFTGLVLGGGVTLLLVALARAKELQTRELRERNRVIEEQVRRQTQELAQARDQALLASRVKSDFLASMSHEIRTPLNAIIGMAELLAETTLSAEQQKYVGVFKNAGEALLSLVNDILDLSKIEAEQLVLEHIEFDLRALVEQSTDIYALKTSEKALELAAHVASDIATTLLGDPSRLRQIILNLIGNAIKFTERGEVVIWVEKIADSNASEKLLFSVRDSGIGIPAAKLEAIFGSFTQVDSSTTRKYGGTGLGLTISKKLVEKMAGRIWVESVEGEGSTFKFEIEFARGPEPRKAPVQTLNGMSILIVDDSDTNRTILRDMLEVHGGSVVGCRDGAEAVAMYTKRAGTNAPFEIVVCDAQMPGMDGFAVIDAIVRQSGAVKTVMMLTPANLDQDLRSARSLALGAYLVKPIKHDELMRVIDEVLEARAPGVSAPQESPPAGPGGRRHSILLVEDNADNRLLIKAYLKREPFDIDEAENGMEALELFKAKNYDLVLMDVQMPIMDGHAATREIRAHEAESGAASIPVIALTAHAIKEDMDKSIAAGCTAHLTKPIKKQVLLAALAEHL